MKKTLLIIILLAIIGGVAWKLRNRQPAEGDIPPAVSATSVTDVTDKLAQYTNEELGFSVKYPKAWTTESSPSGVIFLVPTSTLSTKPLTINKVQVSIDVVPGKCTFPQVTTINERDSIKVKGVNFDMIAMSNTLSGRSYFNRMYSTPKQGVCYFFNFSSITADPTKNKSYSASEAQAIAASNKDAVSAADTLYKEMIKTFEYVVSPEGDNEALHSSTTPRK